MPQNAFTRSQWVNATNNLVSCEIVSKNPWNCLKLDESTARQQLKSPRSLSRRSYTWPWSSNGHSHEWPTATPFVQCQLAFPFWDTAISKFDYENSWSQSCVWSKVHITFDLQNSKVKVMVEINPIGHIWGPAYEPVQKHKVTPCIPGWLNYWIESMSQRVTSGVICGAPFYWHRLTLTRTWISKCIHVQQWGLINQWWFN